jgi:hypothetical protein
MWRWLPSLAALGVAALCLDLDTRPTGSLQVLDVDQASGVVGSRTAFQDEETTPYFKCKVVTDYHCNVENDMTPCTATCSSCSMCSTNPGLFGLRKCRPVSTENICVVNYGMLVFCGWRETGSCGGVPCLRGFAGCTLNGGQSGACGNVQDEC